MTLDDCSTENNSFNGIKSYVELILQIKWESFKRDRIANSGTTL